MNFAIYRICVVSAFLVAVFHYAMQSWWHYARANPSEIPPVDVLEVHEEFLQALRDATSPSTRVNYMFYLIVWTSMYLSVWYMSCLVCLRAAMYTAIGRTMSIPKWLVLIVPFYIIDAARGIVWVHLMLSHSHGTEATLAAVAMASYVTHYVAWGAYVSGSVGVLFGVVRAGVKAAVGKDNK